MTIYQQLKQTIADLKSAEASFETFYYQTKDEQAKKIFEDAFKTAQSVIGKLETRLLQIEKAEPQYKTLGQKKTAVFIERRHPKDGPRRLKG